MLTPEQETALMAYKTRLSGMELYRRVVKRLRKIRRIQAAYDKAKHAGEDLSPFAARPAFKLSTECLFYLTNWAVALLRAIHLSTAVLV